MPLTRAVLAQGEAGGAMAERILEFCWPLHQSPATGTHQNFRCHDTAHHSANININTNTDTDTDTDTDTSKTQHKITQHNTTQHNTTQAITVGPVRTARQRPESRGWAATVTASSGLGRWAWAEVLSCVVLNPAVEAGEQGAKGED